MGFNFGAFVGGFSKQLVADLEAEEERQFEMEKIAQTEAMRQRAAASSRRRSEQLATEQMMGALSMFYGPDVAAQIAARGETAVDFAMDAGQRAMERGLDPNQLWRMPGSNGDVTDPRTQETFDRTIDAADPPAEITTGVMGEGGATPTISGGTFGLDRDVYATIYGEPEDFAATHTAYLAQIAQRMARAPDEETRAALREEEAAALESYARVKAAESVPGEPTRAFTQSQFETIVKNHLSQAYVRNNFEVGIDANILNRTEGTEHLVYISEIEAAQSLQNTYGQEFRDDPLVVDRINQMFDRAQQDLISYGRAVRFEGTSERLKIEDGVDGAVFQERVQQGAYRPGDVIRVANGSGGFTFVVYTGSPMPMNTNSNGEAMPFLFLD